jgi:hypothetical protein
VDIITGEVAYTPARRNTARVKEEVGKSARKKSVVQIWTKGGCSRRSALDEWNLRAGVKLHTV